MCGIRILSSLSVFRPEQVWGPDNGQVFAVHASPVAVGCYPVEVSHQVLGRPVGQKSPFLQSLLLFSYVVTRNNSAVPQL